MKRVLIGAAIGLLLICPLSCVVLYLIGSSVEPAQDSGAATQARTRTRSSAKTSPQAGDESSAQASVERSLLDRIKNDPDYAEWMAVDAKTKKVPGDEESAREVLTYLSEMDLVWKTDLEEYLEKCLKAYDAKRVRLTIAEARSQLKKRILGSILLKGAVPLDLTLGQFGEIAEKAGCTVKNKTTCHEFSAHWNCYEFSSPESENASVAAAQSNVEADEFVATTTPDGRLVKAFVSLKGAPVPAEVFTRERSAQDEFHREAFISRLTALSTPPEWFAATMESLFGEDAQVAHAELATIREGPKGEFWSGMWKSNFQINDKNVTVFYSLGAVSLEVSRLETERIEAEEISLLGDL